MNEVDLIFFAMSLPFILTLLYFGFLFIVVLITTDWEKEKEITKLMEDKQNVKK